jgi:hypothetical protein
MVGPGPRIPPHGFIAAAAAHRFGLRSVESQHRGRRRVRRVLRARPGRRKEDRGADHRGNETSDHGHSAPGLRRPGGFRGVCDHPKRSPCYGAHRYTHFTPAPFAGHTMRTEDTAPRVLAGRPPRGPSVGCAPRTSAPFAKAPAAKRPQVADSGAPYCDGLLAGELTSGTRRRRLKSLARSIERITRRSAHY